MNFGIVSLASSPSSLEYSKDLDILKSLEITFGCSKTHLLPITGVKLVSNAHYSHIFKVWQMLLVL